VKKEQGTGENCVSDCLHNLYCSPNIIWVITPRNIMGVAMCKMYLVQTGWQGQN